MNTYMQRWQDANMHGKELIAQEMSDNIINLLVALREVTACLNAITTPGEYETELKLARNAIRKAEGKQ